MRSNNAEIITTNNTENMVDIQRQAELIIDQIGQDAQEAQEEAQSLELELMEAQTSHEAREEAERQGQETGEKIGALA